MPARRMTEEELYQIGKEFKLLKKYINERKAALSFDLDEKVTRIAIKYALERCLYDETRTSNHKTRGNPKVRKPHN